MTDAPKLPEVDWPFGDLPRHHYGALLVDPPWHFKSWTTPRWNGRHDVQSPTKAPPYDALNLDEIEALPVGELAAPDCVLFCWGIWVMLPRVLGVIQAWGFEYKTCAFNWLKADLKQMDLLRETDSGQLGLGYWVRQNSEFCLLATRGNPKRLHADVRQGIIEPRREHSRKPDGVPGRIERLVAGPYVELFARTTRPGWDSWGNQTDKFAPLSPIAGSEPQAQKTDESNTSSAQPNLTPELGSTVEPGA